ncbi:MAG: AAA family ATPase [Elusimicrobiota bacterium]
MKIKTVFSVILAGVYFSTQVVFVSAQENNFWADRRKHVVQLSSLPAETDNPISFLKSMPFPKINLIPSAAKEEPIEALIPHNLGSIQERYEGKGSKSSPLYLIQDIHMNAEAQLNIAGMLESLIKEKKINFVGIEGAFGKFNFAPFRIFQSRPAISKVLRTFLDRALIPAHVYTGIQDWDQIVDFEGVDDQTEYLKNVQAYLVSKENRNIQDQIFENARQLKILKNTVYSASLKKFDSVQESYRNGKLDFGAYLSACVSLTPTTNADVLRFLKAYRLEKDLDFQRVDRERSAVLEKCVHKLTEPELKRLVALSLSYRSGQLSFGIFYSELKRICQTRGVGLDAFPAFRKYLEYVDLAEKIKPLPLLKAASAIEKETAKILAVTLEEKDVVCLSDFLSLVDKLRQFSLTPEEWNEYQNLNLSARRKAEERGLRIPDLTSFEQFYVSADVRSRKIIDKLFSDASPKKSRALIIGGFHVPLITALLQKKNISYVVLSPRITKVDLGEASSYLSVFSREKVLLDRVFSGRKLFLNPTMMASMGTGHPVAQGRVDTLMSAQAAQTAKDTNNNNPAGYEVIKGENGFFRVIDQDGKEIIVNPETGETKKSKYTRFVGPLLETFVFYGLFYLLRLSLKEIGYSHTWMVYGLLVIFVTTLHMVLRRDFSRKSIRDWVIGSAIILLPFTGITFFDPFGGSLILHLIWNNLGFVTPLSMIHFDRRPDSNTIQSVILKSKRTLIFTDTPDVVEAFLKEEAEREATNKERELFLSIKIRDQQDLNQLLTSVWVDGQDLSRGEGPLLEILKKGGVLHIDYDNSVPGFVERFNSLFANSPYFKNINVSPNLKIVGTISSENVRKYPVTFYSRFKKKLELDTKGWADNVPRAESGMEAETFEMFEADLSRQDLIGRYALDESGRFYFVPGPLVNALDKKIPLIIKGARWNDPRLQGLLWQIFHYKRLLINGKWRDIPDNFFYRQDVDYSEVELSNKTIVLPGEINDGQTPFLVNRENFRLLFNRNEIVGTQLKRVSGFLFQPSVVLRITTELPDHVWHQIFHSPNAIRVELNPGVEVPENYKKHFSDKLKRAPPARIDGETLSATNEKKALIVESKDLGFALDSIRQTFSGQKIFVKPITAFTSISEISRRIRVENDKGVWKFDSEIQSVIAALKRGEIVVLEAMHSNPELFWQLESLLLSTPYLADSAGMINLDQNYPGKIIFLTSPSPETALIGKTRVFLEENDEKLQELLEQELGSKFNKESFKKVRELQAIFETIPTPPATNPHLYPSRPNFSYNRLKMLFQYDNWLDAFEEVFINDYKDVPEIESFMRTMVRLKFKMPEPGRAPSAIAGNKLRKVLAKWVPSRDENELVWQMADCLSLDLLDVPEKFTHEDLDEVKFHIKKALIKNSPPSLQRMYIDRFNFRDIDVSDAPSIDIDTQVGELTDSELTRNISQALAKFNAVVFKGSPGTGKSQKAKEIAKGLDYTINQIFGPVTVGEDLKPSDIIGKYKFENGKTAFKEEEVSRWKNAKRGILIVDEANLTHPTFWNSIREYIDSNHQVIFTGNQESLTGRQFQDYLVNNVVTFYFPPFSDKVIQDVIESNLGTDKDRRPELKKQIFRLFKLFEAMGPEKGFSLRNVQELVARVNRLMPSDWDPKEIAFLAWSQFKGVFDADDRRALSYIFVREWGINVYNYEKKRAAEMRALVGDQFEKKGITLVDSAALTVADLNSALKMRSDRVNRKTTIQGQRGMIIEGPSGRGKDEVLYAALISQVEDETSDIIGTLFKALYGEEGLKLVDVKSEGLGIPGERKCYFLNGSFDFDELEKVINQAKIEGSIVVVSELNFLPSSILEGKLNDVLTGEAKEGFFFIGTMNSSHFSGREKLSTALQNRVVYQREDDYNEQELTEILESKLPALSVVDRKYIVKAHIFIRNSIEDVQYHPTTRDILNIVDMLNQDPIRDVASVVAENYAFFLKYLLNGEKFPSSEELLLVTEKIREDNVLVLSKVGSALLPKGRTPFEVVKEKKRKGAYNNLAKNRIGIPEERFINNFWQPSFDHELSHSLFTREFEYFDEKFSGIFDDLYQDLEDLRHLNAFNTYFSASRAFKPNPKEERISNIIRNLDLDGSDSKRGREDGGLFAWLNQQNPISVRGIFQLTLRAYVKGLLTQKQISDMAEICEGFFEVNPFLLMITKTGSENKNHLDRTMEIKNSIPKSFYEIDVLEAQHQALVLMEEMYDDFLSLKEFSSANPAPTLPSPKAGIPGIASLQTVESEFLEKPMTIDVLGSEDVSPTNIDPASVPVVSVEEKKQQLAEKRNVSMADTKKALVADMEGMEKALVYSDSLSAAALVEMRSRFSVTHPLSVKTKLDKLSDLKLNKKSEKILEKINQAIRKLERMTEEEALSEKPAGRRIPRLIFWFGGILILGVIVFLVFNGIDFKDVSNVTSPSSDITQNAKDVSVLPNIELPKDITPPAKAELPKDMTAPIPANASPTKGDVLSAPKRPALTFVEKMAASFRSENLAFTFSVILIVSSLVLLVFTLISRLWPRKAPKPIGKRLDEIERKFKPPQGGFHNEGGKIDLEPESFYQKEKSAVLVSYAGFAAGQVRSAIFYVANQEISGINKAFQQFIEKKVVAANTYGPDGDLDDIQQFLSDPSNGFVRAGGQEKLIKKQVVVRLEREYESYSTTHAILQHLYENGFRVITTKDSIPDHQMQSLLQFGPTSFVTDTELLNLVGDLYLNRSIRWLLETINEPPPLERPLTIEEEVEYFENWKKRYKPQITMDTEQDGYYWDMANVNYPIPELGKMKHLLGISLKGSFIQDLSPFMGSSVSTVDISGSLIFDLEPLIGCENLKTLIFSDQFITLGQIAWLLKHHPNGKHIEIIKDGLKIDHENITDSPQRYSDLNLTPAQRLERLSRILSWFEITLDEGSIDLNDRVLQNLEMLTFARSEINKLNIYETYVKNIEPLLRLSYLQSVDLGKLNLKSADINNILEKHPNRELKVNWYGREFSSTNLVPETYDKYKPEFTPAEVNALIEEEKPRIENAKVKITLLSQQNGEWEFKANNVPVSQLEQVKFINQFRHVNVSNTLVYDLRPLKGNGVNVLDISNTLVYDLRPLLKMPYLQSVTCDLGLISEEQIEYILSRHPNPNLKFNTGTKILVKPTRRIFKVKKEFDQKWLDFSNKETTKRILKFYPSVRPNGDPYVKSFLGYDFSQTLFWDIELIHFLEGPIQILIFPNSGEMRDQRLVSLEGIKELQYLKIKDSGFSPQEIRYFLLHRPDVQVFTDQYEKTKNIPPLISIDQQIEYAKKLIKEANPDMNVRVQEMNSDKDEDQYGEILVWRAENMITIRAPQINIPKAIDMYLPDLLSLFLYGDNPSLVDISPLTRIRGLKEIHIESSGIRALPRMDRMKKLEILIINNSPLDDIAGLEACKSLTRVAFKNTNITDTLAVDGLPSLMRVSITRDSKYESPSEVFEGLILQILGDLVDPVSVISRIKKKFEAEGLLAEYDIADKLAGEWPGKDVLANFSLGEGVQTIADSKVNLSPVEEETAPNYASTIDSLIKILFSPGNLEVKNAEYGKVLQQLLTLSPDAEVYVSRLISSPGSTSLAVVLGDPDIDETGFFEQFEKRLQTELKDQQISPNQFIDLLYELSRLGVPEKTLTQMFESSEELIKQVVVIIKGPEDIDKLTVIKKIVNERRPVFAVNAKVGLDKQGRLQLSLIHQHLDEWVGNGLSDSLLILPDGMAFDVDLPENVVRTLLIATLNETLNGKLLTSHMLKNILKIHQIILKNA